MRSARARQVCRSGGLGGKFQREPRLLAAHRRKRCLPRRFPARRRSRHIAGAAQHIVDRIVVPAVPQLISVTRRRRVRTRSSKILLRSRARRQLETQDRDAHRRSHCGILRRKSARPRAARSAENLIIGGGERLGAQREIPGAGRNSIVSSRASAFASTGEGSKRNLREFAMGSAPSAALWNLAWQKREKAGFGGARFNGHALQWPRFGGRNCKARAQASAFAGALGVIVANFSCASRRPLSGRCRRQRKS